MTALNWKLTLFVLFLTIYMIGLWRVLSSTANDESVSWSLVKCMGYMIWGYIGAALFAIWIYPNLDG